jgi:hypothetical protein
MHDSGKKDVPKTAFSGPPRIFCRTDGAAS